MNLNKKISLKEFDETYWLKSDLHNFCKSNNINSIGSKEELSNKIRSYLTGEKIPVYKQSKSIRKADSSEIELDKLISSNYANDELHRTFFKKHIANFKFNVAFMNWMKINKQLKTYSDAIIEYNKILSDKKNGKKTYIPKQFKYNRYTRDFFTDNPSLTKADCIKCWNYKKKLPGNHKYEKSDLEVLRIFRKLL